MASETITRNDLTNILNEVLPANNGLKYKDFTNVQTDSNGFVNTGLQDIIPLWATNRGGAITGASQIQMTLGLDAVFSLRFLNWSAATAFTGQISFRLWYIEAQ